MAGLAHAPVDALTRYRIQKEDVAGPFVPRIPSDLVEQSRLPALVYTSPREALAEKFHASPALLKRFNPACTFAAGEEIMVPNVAGLPQGPPPESPTVVGTTGTSAASVSIVVSRETSSLAVQSPDGTTIFYAPVTVGSVHDPLPIGDWQVTVVQMNPTFHYNPDLFWDANPSHSTAKIPAGPNNPVGVAWIGLTLEHYGIHGTPEPSLIGRTQSHGCVRLTNWDALRVARLVKPGTPVHFR